MIKAQYLIAYHACSGQITFVLVRPPLNVRSARPDTPAFNDRGQLSQDDLLAMIGQAKSMLVMG